MGVLFRKYMGDAVLFTTDGAGDWYLKRGAVPSIYPTVDFGPGTDAKKAFNIQRKYSQHGPSVSWQQICLLGYISVLYVT